MPCPVASIVAAVGRSGMPQSGDIAEESGGLFASGLEDETNLFTTDFTSKTEVSSATATVSTDAPNHGAKNGQFNYNGTGLADVKKTLGDQADLYVRIYFKLKTGFAQESGYISLLNIFDGTTKLADVILYNTGAGFYLKCYVESPTVASIYDGTAGDIVTNQVYCLEMRYRSHASTGGVQVWLDGTQKGSRLDLNTSTQVPDQFWIGDVDDSVLPTNGSVLYFDDVVAASAAIGAFPFS